MPPDIPASDVCDLVEAQFQGRRFAYCPVAVGVALGRLSIVVEGEIGHYPMHDHFAFGTMAEMAIVAEQLNRTRLRVTAEEAVGLVMRSMWPKRGTRH